MKKKMREREKVRRVEPADSSCVFQKIEEREIF